MKANQGIDAYGRDRLDEDEFEHVCETCGAIFGWPMEATNGWWAYRHDPVCPRCGGEGRCLE